MELSATAEKPAPTALPAASLEPAYDYSPIMRAVANLREDLTQYRGGIAAIDSGLPCTVSQDEQALRECVERFQRFNSSHLEAHGPHLEQIELVAADGRAA